MEKVNVDVLDQMSELMMELDAMRTLVWCVVREEGELDPVQKGNVLYFVGETLDRMYEDSTGIVDAIDYLIMELKRN